MSTLNPGNNIFYPTSSITNENVQSSFSATSSVQNRSMSPVLLSKAVFLFINGGMVQDELISIMMRFRKHPFAYIVDIQKRYGMINIHPSQRNLQRIVWKDSELCPVKTFELSTVTYGSVSAPFLATQTLLQIAEDEGNNFLLATSIIKEDFYVDDVLSDAKILPKWIEMIEQQLTSMLNRTSMKLHKWRGGRHVAVKLRIPHFKLKRI
ncbi:integrase catalytic domain-containing protein [Nephila pilipes]|uniref:Integrase catalytic domain-containing protein n=1 Tax=Nephila pilipes TaxID=299642 RepID=A0A8X6NQV2_NEPPI|nr:integrase catalytic domain-containing protein [Nephila pilipes]